MYCCSFLLVLLLFHGALGVNFQRLELGSEETHTQSEEKLKFLNWAGNPDVEVSFSTLMDPNLMIVHDWLEREQESYKDDTNDVDDGVYMYNDSMTDGDINMYDELTAAYDMKSDYDYMFDYMTSDYDYMTSDYDYTFDDYKTSDYDYMFDDYMTSDYDYMFDDYKTSDYDYMFDYMTSDYDYMFDDYMTSDYDYMFDDYMTSDYDYMTSDYDYMFDDYKTSDYDYVTSVHSCLFDDYMTFDYDYMFEDYITTDYYMFDYYMELLQHFK